MLPIILFFPGIQEPLGDFSLVPPKELEKERAVEPALYISDEFEISPNFTISGGLRTTYFTSFGPEQSLCMLKTARGQLKIFIDTISYGKGEVIKSYPGFEFRISARLILSPRTSVKFGVQRVYQYLHMISNTTSMSPTDIWKLSDSYIKPEMGDQFSIGFTIISAEELLKHQLKPIIRICRISLIIKEEQYY